jgi:hypothetical protein
VVLRTLTRPRLLAVLLAICLLGAALRTVGITYGLPAIYNPDETPILNRALTLAKGDLNPHNFVYPSLYFYLLFVWEAAFFVAGRLAGAFDSLAEFQRQFFINPSAHFLAGRAFSVLCGTLTILALYWFGRRLYDKPTGLAAAAFLAVAPVAVRDAHYVKLDVPVTLFVVLAHGALARIIMDPGVAARRGSWFLAGVLSGLAVSTQYYAIFLAFSIIAVAMADVRRSDRRWQHTATSFLWCVAGAAAGFLAGTPFLLVDLQKALADIAHVREVDVDRAIAGGVFSATGAYLRILFLDAVGWPVWLAAVTGAVWALATDWRRGLLLVSFFGPFFAFVANTVPMSRYLNVVLPLVALAAAVAVIKLSRLAVRNRTPAAIALVVAAMTPGLIASIRTSLFIREADTRTLAREYLEHRLRPGESVLIQPYSVPLRPSRDVLVDALRQNLGSESRASAKFQNMLALDPYPEPAYRLIYLGDDDGLDVDKIFISPGDFSEGDDLAALRSLGVRYVILKQSNTRNPSLIGLESALRREAQRMAFFTPYRPETTPRERANVPPFMHNTAARLHPALARPGPIVEIWMLNY